MTASLIAVYHNTDSRFFEYQDGHTLTQVISHWRQLPAGASARWAADWAFRVFNIDLDQLEPDRATPEGEDDFLIACVYRMLRLRSLSVGDVVAVSIGDNTQWLACESFGWREIAAPSNVGGEPLSARRAYANLDTRRPVLYRLPERRPPVTLVGPDNEQFWARVGTGATGRHALILGDPATPAAAMVVAGTLVELQRWLDPFTGTLHADLTPALHQVRAGLTDDDWAALHHHDEPAAPQPVPADVDLIVLPHTGLRVPHARLDVTGYRELPTAHGVAYTATLRLDGHRVGAIHNEGMGGATTFRPDGSRRFGWRDLAGYAQLSRTAAGFRTTEEGVLDDLITEALTDAHIRRAEGAGRLALRLVALIDSGGYVPIAAGDAAPPRDDADLRRLIERLSHAQPPAGQWWQRWTGRRWDDLTTRPAIGPDRT